MFENLTERYSDMWKFSIVVNMVGWAVLTINDYFDETTVYGMDMLSVISVVPALAGVAYIIWNLLLRKEGADTIKECLKNVGKWSLVSGLFGVLINVAVANEWWFVKQATGGWENFLNGIEYGLFALFMTGGVLVVIVLWNILRWFFLEIKKVF